MIFNCCFHVVEVQVSFEFFTNIYEMTFSIVTCKRLMRVNSMQLNIKMLCQTLMHDLLLCWSVGDTKHIEIT